MAVNTKNRCSQKKPAGHKKGPQFSHKYSDLYIILKSNDEKAVSNSNRCNQAAKQGHLEVGFTAAH